MSTAAASAPGPAPVQFSEEQFKELLATRTHRTQSGGFILSLSNGLRDLNSQAGELLTVAAEASNNAKAAGGLIDQAADFFVPGWAQERHLEELMMSSAAAADKAEMAVRSHQRQMAFSQSQRQKRMALLAGGLGFLRNGSVGRPTRGRGTMSTLIKVALVVGVVFLVVAGVYYAVRHLGGNQLEVSPAGQPDLSLTGGGY